MSYRAGMALLFATAAMAPMAIQQAQAQTQSTSANANSGIEEVTVTAQKRSEKQVNVPISVVAVSEQKLQDSGVRGMGDLSQLVPALHVDASGAFFQPSIRGVGTAIAGAGASANVATYVDGIYKPNALSNDFDFIDIDSIQVLKGPQGTLFGRNATGGAILVTTKQPSFDPELELQAGYGSFNTMQGRFFVSDGLTDTLAVSAAGGFSHSDGWVRNLVDGKKINQSNDYTGRVKFLWQPSDRIKFTLGIDAERVSDPTLYAASSYKGFSDAGAFFGVPLQTANDPRKVSLSGGIIHNVSGQGGNLKGEFDLGWADLTSYTSIHFDHGDERTNEAAAQYPTNGTLPVQPCPTLFTCEYLGTGGFNYISTAGWHYVEHTYSQEFDLGQSGKGPLDWVTGLYYFKDITAYSPFYVSLYGPFGPGGALSGALPPWPASSFVNTGFINVEKFSATSESYAAFADLTYDLGDLSQSLEGLHITLGGRYSVDKAGATFTGNPSPLGPGTPDLKGNHTWKSFTPRAVLRYSLTPDSNIYVSWSNGTKAGLFNASGFPAQSTPVKPEHIEDFEGGYKIAKDDWQLEASVFHYNYRDLQVATYIGASAFFENAKRAEITGGDLHWLKQLTDNLNLDIGLAYTHARYTDFTAATVQTFDPLFGVVNGTGDVSGKPMERTPTFTGSLGLSYNHPLFGGSLELSGNYAYQTKSSFDFASTLVQGSYGLLNLRAAWTDPTGHWNVSVVGRNVTDQTYLTEVLPNAGGFGQNFGEPANYMFNIAYQY